MALCVDDCFEVDAEGRLSLRLAEPSGCDGPYFFECTEDGLKLEFRPQKATYLAPDPQSGPDTLSTASPNGDGQASLFTIEDDVANGPISAWHLDGGDIVFDCRGLYHIDAGGSLHPRLQNGNNVWMESAEPFRFLLRLFLNGTPVPGASHDYIIGPNLAAGSPVRIAIPNDTSESHISALVNADVGDRLSLVTFAGYRVGGQPIPGQHNHRLTLAQYGVWAP